MHDTLDEYGCEVSDEEQQVEKEHVAVVSAKLIEQQCFSCNNNQNLI
jgi:hypothetical protein